MMIRAYDTPACTARVTDTETCMLADLIAGKRGHKCHKGICLKDSSTLDKDGNAL